MAAQDDGGTSVAMSMHLERKLPLLMTAVLFIILAVGVSLAYREVRHAAELVARERVKQVADQLAELLVASQPRIARTLRGAADDPAVRRALAGGPSEAETAAAAAALRRVLAPRDSGVRVDLLGVDRRAIASASAPDFPTEFAPSAAAEQLLDQSRRDSARTTPFYMSAGRVFYSTVVPIVADGEPRGWVAQHRRLNSQPVTERSFARLTGQNVVIFFRNADGSLWTTIGGKAVRPPAREQTVRGMRTFEHPEGGTDGRVLLSEATIPGVPWIVALELPLSSLAPGPRSMLRRFLAFSLILLLAGAAALWVISRGVTRPLARLADAAGAFAGGDYTRRVQPAGGREIAQLAERFNHMAEETAAAHGELQQRYREAQSLARELEQTNEQLQETTEAAEKAQSVAESANAAKSSFLAAMSHELRTPLNAIAGYVQLLEMGLRGPVTPEQHADLARIRRSQSYLLSLIDEVLNFARLDAHQMEFRMDSVPVDAMLRDVKTLIDPQLRSAGVIYTYGGCDSAIAIRGDREKTQQIILNLITNAIKFSDPPGEAAVRCEALDHQVRIVVTDTGMGIGEEDMARIFEPFVQLDRSLNQPREGVGLGLTISRDFAREMGGDLLVESAVGKGSVFTLVMPRAVPGVQQISAA